MKKWFALACAVGILIGVGALLLYTRQAPLVEDADPTAISASGFTVTSTDTAALATPVPHDDGQEHTGEGAVPMQPKGIDPLQGKRLSVEEFRTLSAQVAKDLPTKTSVKGISDKDAHTMPKPILDAGAQLGMIAQAVSNEPSLARDAYLFYEKCAGSNQYLDAVRALCFSNYKDQGTKLGLPVREEAAPAKIRELAEKIQGL